MTVAYCWRSGELEFGRSVPQGAMLILRGPQRLVRNIVEPACRLAYDNTTLLVPGIPEAEDDDEAVSAALTFKSWIETRVRTRGLRQHQLARGAADQVQP